MTRIHKYALRELLGPSLVGLLAYGLLLMMNLALQAAEMAIRRDLPLALVAQFILLSLPRILVMTLPMAVLLGVLVGIGRLQADHELRALKSLGINARSLVRPAAVLGAAGAVVTWFLFDTAVPASNYAQHQLQARIYVSSDLNRELQPRAFFEKIPNLLIYADSADPATGTLERVLLHQRNSAGEDEISTAGRARIEYQERDGALKFRLEDVVSHSWNRKKPDAYQVAVRDEETIIRPPDLFTTEMLRSLDDPPPRNLREQSVLQLMDSIRQYEAMPEGPGKELFLNDARVELHKKFAIPATCFVFAVLGVPLALAQRRGGKAWGFLISLLVIALQYFLLTVGEQMADRGEIEPWVGMWAGNIAFFVLAVLLLTLGRRWTWDPSRIISRLVRTKELEHEEDERHAEADALPARPSTRKGRSPAGAGTGTGDEEEIRPKVVLPLWRRLVPAVDLYLLRTLVFVGILVALSLSLLFALYATLEFMQSTSQGDKPLSLLFQYVVNVLPQFFTSYVLPLDLCAATLITFALLSRTQELTAFRSAGIGPLRVSGIFVSVALLTTIVSFGAFDSVLPATNQKAMQIRDKLKGRSPRSYNQTERRWVFGSRGELISFRVMRHDDSQIQGLNIFRFNGDGYRIRNRTFARRARWEPARGWVLTSGWVRSFDRSGESFQEFEEKIVQNIDPPDYFSQEWKAPAQMNMAELQAHVADMERRGYETRELRVDLHRKLATPAICLVMVLIALPFGLRIDRRGPLFGLGIALLIAGIYFFMMQASGKLGEIGVLPPILAAWGPNMVFSGTGLYLITSSRW